jgi:acyl-CoA synthetase (AMP-forming)/AMP-acid ligase II
MTTTMTPSKIHSHRSEEPDSLAAGDDEDSSGDGAATPAGVVSVGGAASVGELASVGAAEGLGDLEPGENDGGEKLTLLLPDGLGKALLILPLPQPAARHPAARIATAGTSLLSILLIAPRESGQAPVPKHRAGTRRTHHPSRGDALSAVWGEPVRASVVPVPGGQPEAADLIARGQLRLASFKKPKSAIFVRERPESPDGKILNRMPRSSRLGNGGMRALVRVISSPAVRGRQGVPGGHRAADDVFQVGAAGAVAGLHGQALHHGGVVAGDGVEAGR